MLSIRHWMNYCCREWYAFNLSVRPGQGERGGAGGGAGEATTTLDGGHLQYIPSHDAHSTLGLSFPLLLLLEPQLPPVFPPFPPQLHIPWLLHLQLVGFLPVRRLCWRSAGGAGVERCCTRMWRGSSASSQPLLAGIKLLNWDVSGES